MLTTHQNNSTENGTHVPLTTAHNFLGSQLANLPLQLPNIFFLSFNKFPASPISQVSTNVLGITQEIPNREKTKD